MDYKKFVLDPGPSPYRISIGVDEGGSTPEPPFGAGAGAAFNWRRFRQMEIEIRRLFRLLRQIADGAAANPNDLRRKSTRQTEIAGGA